MPKKAGSIFLLLFVSGLFFACSKGGTTTDDGSGGPHIVTDNDTTRPVLTVTTPVTNQVYSNGAVINVTGSITDDLGLYRGSIRITNDATGEIVKEQLYEIHGVLAYTFNVSAMATVTTATDFTVSVFYEDHGLNGVSRSLKVKMNP
jgi:hypothetical protein